MVSFYGWSSNASRLEPLGGAVYFLPLNSVNCDSLYARLDSHYGAWSYKKKKYKMVTVYSKTV